MVIIRSRNWGDFEALTLKEAKEKFVEEIAPENTEEFTIDEIVVGDVVLKLSTPSEIEIKLVEIELENEIKEWRRVAKIESEGLRRAQQESMEG